VTGQVGSAHAPQRRGVLLNFLSLAASAWSQQFLNFLTVIYLARVLGADALGQVMLAQAIVLYFRFGADMGLDLLGARRVAKTPALAASIVGTFTGVRLMNASVCFVALLLTAAGLQLIRPVGWMVAAFGLLLVPIALSLEWAFTGLERMELVGAFRFVVAALWLGIIVGFVRTPDAVLVVPLANVAAMCAGALMLFAVFRRQYGRVMAVFSIPSWERLVRGAAPTGVSLVLIQVYVGFGVVAVGLMEGETAAGLYGAPQKLVLFLTAISSMFGSALYPRLSALHDKGREAFEGLMSVGLRAMLLAGVPLGVGGALVAPSLIEAVYGPEYAASAAVFRWLVLSVILSFANIPFGYALLAAGRQRPYFRASAAGAAINVAATVALIPRLHLLGPAVATLITEGVVLTILVVASRGVGRVSCGRTLVPVGVSAAAMAAGILAVQPASLPVCVLLGAGIYVAGLVLTGGLRRSDLDALRLLRTQSAKSEGDAADREVGLDFDRNLPGVGSDPERDRAARGAARRIGD
jgi:O-antigen/teichoic acid export membrane protein